ncbi:putative Endonuclease-reverse transcriptase [Trypanosoma cruzi]|uniref:Putative Endonuclease-reverse transcriptase n=1 Tax=Trypanosoma cruzi TaxID=5693 RepID=A0A2V2UMF0_TRYCR|nr:putative Endonuclease-reverse transcriptase [Trypanosoma cruzi]
MWRATTKATAKRRHCAEPRPHSSTPDERFLPHAVKTRNINGARSRHNSHSGDLEVVGADRQYAHWRLRAPCTVAHRQRSGVAVLVRKALRSKRIPLTIPQHDTGHEVVVVQVALYQNRDLIVASVYMRPPPQVTQSFRRLVNCLPASTPLLLCGDFNMRHPQWEPFLETSPSEVAAEFLELCTDAGLTLVNTPGEITYARGTRERSCIDLTWSKHLTVSDWSASVSPLSDHYMLTFTLHQAFKDTIPSAPKFFYSWGKCKWDLFIEDFDAQLPAYDYKKQSTGIKAFTRALITSYRRHCPRGMHKDGPRLWDDTLMEAERMATDSKARYLQLPTPDREAEMQRTRSQFFLLLRERLRNTYLHRISKLNPGESLAWK